MRYFFSILIILFLLQSCLSTLHPWAHINTIPMYGNVTKPEEIITADKKFVKSAIEQFGTVDSAAYVHAMLGWSLLHEGDMETSIRRFNQSWLIDSSKADAYFGFAGYQEVKGENDYNKYYRMGVIRDKNHKSEMIYLQNMALFYNNSPYKKKTISFTNRILEIDPNDVLAYTLRGYSYESIEEWHKSINDLEKSLELGGIEHYLYLTYDKLGYAYMQIQNDSLAIKYYEKSIELNPTFLYPLYRSSVIYFRQGKYVKALEYIDKCLDIDKNEQFLDTKKQILAAMKKK